MANSDLGREQLTLEQICEMMPKVELHAHLNGSISDSIIQKLKLKGSLSTPNSANKDSTAKRPKLDTEDGQKYPVCDDTSTVYVGIQETGERSLSECWKAFSKIHDLIRTPEILFQATCEVIEEFAKDNVIYLELRTTPKRVHAIVSKQIYIETVINAIKYCTNEKNLPIIVKLLISIDRGNSSRDHLENVCLAQWYTILHPKIIVGLDLCGDPNKGDTKKILFALSFSKKMNQRLSIHLPEVINVKETKLFMEQVCADRVAHGHYLHPSNGGSKELWKTLKDKGTCMETCITSNLITGVCPNLERHYVKLLHDDDIPFVICTDDSGVFNSTLSQEYKKFLQLVPLSKSELKTFCIRSVSYIFDDQVQQEHLMRKMEIWWEHNVSI